MTTTKSRTFRLSGAAVALLTLTVPLTASAADTSARHRPDRYVVSETPDTLPEGIHVTRAGTMYVTSKGTGTVYRGSVRDPRLQEFLPAGEDGRITATGVHVDPWGRVLVAGAETSTFWMYDADGELLARRTVPDGAFLNDFAFARGHLYVTDSATDTIYRARLDASGLGELEPWLSTADFPVDPDFLNGIVATPGGRVLLVADWLQQRTFRINVRTKAVEVVRLFGDSPERPGLGGDGLLLEGHTLYAVTNKTVGEQLVSWTRKVRLSDDWRRAYVVDDSPFAEAGHQPTTIARDRGRLLWVDSQFDAWPGTPPYTVDVVRGVR